MSTNKQIIADLEKSISAGIRMLSRDFGEINLLQSSLRVCSKFAIACYKKMVEKTLSEVSKQTTLIYQFNTPKYFNAITEDGFCQIEVEQQKQSQDAIGEFFYIPVSSVVNLTRGINLVSSSICIKQNQEQFASHSFVYDLSSESRFSATYLEGAYKNDSKIKTSTNKKIKYASIVIDAINQALTKNLTQQDKQSIAKIRSFSLNNLTYTVNNLELSLCYLASAKFDCVISFDLNSLSECKAGVLIAKEAGALFCYADGSQVDFKNIDNSHSFVAIFSNEDIKKDFFNTVAL